MSGEHQHHEPEPQAERDVPEEVRRALAHPTLAEAKADKLMWPSGD